VRLALRGRRAAQRWPTPPSRAGKGATRPACGKRHGHAAVRGGERDSGVQRTLRGGGLRGLLRRHLARLSLSDLVAAMLIAA